MRIESVNSILSYSVSICIFSALAGVLLVIFGTLFRSESITFAVLCVKHGWDHSVKSQACMNAAYAYFSLSGVTLLTAVIMQRLGTHLRRQELKKTFRSVTVKDPLEKEALSNFDGVSQFQ